MPKFGDQLTRKLYVDNAFRNNLGESTLLRFDPDEKLNQDEHDDLLKTVEYFLDPYDYLVSNCGADSFEELRVYKFHSNYD